MSIVTMAQRCAELTLALRATRADSNPYLSESWDGASHWRCTLYCGTRKMTVFFSQGSAHTEPPTVEDVVNSLVSDAQSVQTTPTFAEWASEMGYLVDSRNAKATFDAVKDLTDKLRALIDPLGACAWENLLHHTEGL